MAMELSGPRPIVIEPPFVATFFRTEPSNFTISTGIFLTSRIGSNEIRTAPGNKLRKPTSRLVQANDDDGYVVLTTVFIRAAYQSLGGNPNTGDLSQNRGDLVFRHHSRQPVRTEQQRVAREQFNFVSVYVHAFFRSQCPRQKALQFAGGGLLMTHQPVAHLLGDKRMIRGQLLKRIRPEQVGTGIADVGQAQAGSTNTRRYDRGSHSTASRITHSVLMNLSIGHLDGTNQRVRPVRRLRR